MTNFVSICNLEDNPTPAVCVYIVYFIYCKIHYPGFILKMVTLKLSQDTFESDLLLKRLLFLSWLSRKRTHSFQGGPKLPSETNRMVVRRIRRSWGKDNVRVITSDKRRIFLTLFLAVNPLSRQVALEIR